eukprot:PhF_6_TR23956/c0_g1_i3/m.33531
MKNSKKKTQHIPSKRFQFQVQTTARWSGSQRAPSSGHFATTVGAAHARGVMGLMSTVSRCRLGVVWMVMGMELILHIVVIVGCWITRRTIKREVTHFYPRFCLFLEAVCSLRQMMGEMPQNCG